MWSQIIMLRLLQIWIHPNLHIGLTQLVGVRCNRTAELEIIFQNNNLAE